MIQWFGWLTKGSKLVSVSLDSERTIYNGKVYVNVIYTHCKNDIIFRGRKSSVPLTKS